MTINRNEYKQRLIKEIREAKISFVWTDQGTTFHMAERKGSDMNDCNTYLANWFNEPVRVGEMPPNDRRICKNCVAKAYEYRRNEELVDRLSDFLTLPWMLFKSKYIKPSEAPQPDAKAAVLTPDVSSEFVVQPYEDGHVYKFATKEESLAFVEGFVLGCGKAVWKYSEYVLEATEYALNCMTGNRTFRRKDYES